MKALIGIIPEEVLRKRVLAIAAGTYHPQPDEPRVWFASINAIGQVLSNENIALLRLMQKEKPDTLSELAILSGRQLSNLSTTLKTLSGHGFVNLERRGNTVRPTALFTDFEIRVESGLMDRIDAA